MKPPRKILVIVTRRLGDVLLATPLIRTLRESWPDAVMDVLVFKGTEGIISGNPDIGKIITVEEDVRAWPHLKFLLGLVRKYDLAISAMHNDRPVFYAWLAGKHSAGFVPGKGLKHFWKRFLLSRWIYSDNLNRHTVLKNLQLAELMGLPLNYNVVVSWQKPDELRIASLLKFDLSETFAVIHMQPRYAYKEWSKKGWIELARWFHERNINMVFTGMDAEKETDGMDEIFRGMPGYVHNMIGRLNLNETGYLLSQASVYIGPDTVITHMAAALGIPTVALYGPTNPVVWGPWSKDHLSGQNQYIRKGSQSNRNVFLVQGEGDCVPCHEEGCERHIGSSSKCLQDISPEKLIKFVKKALNESEERELSN